MHVRPDNMRVFLPPEALAPGLSTPIQRPRPGPWEPNPALHMLCFSQNLIADTLECITAWSCEKGGEARTDYEF